MNGIYETTPAERRDTLNHQLEFGGRDVFASASATYSPYPGAIENRECIRLFKFAATRRRMKAAHVKGKCWKKCVYDV